MILYRFSQVKLMDISHNLKLMRTLQSHTTFCVTFVKLFSGTIVNFATMPVIIISSFMNVYFVTSIYAQ